MPDEPGVVVQPPAQHPAALLVWGRGLTEAEQLRRCEILSRFVPEPAFKRLLSIPDPVAQEAEVKAVERAYSASWEELQAKRDREDRFIRHLGVHPSCPGITKCTDFNPGGEEERADGCPYCGYPARNMQAHIKRRHGGG